MASITITELRPASSELLLDSESFLNELNEQEMSIYGGRRRRVINIDIDSVVTVISQLSVSIGISLITNDGVVTVRTLA